MNVSVPIGTFLTEIVIERDWSQPGWNWLRSLV